MGTIRVKVKVRLTAIAKGIRGMGIQSANVILMYIDINSLIFREEVSTAALLFEKIGHNVVEIATRCCQSILILCVPSTVELYYIS